MAHARECFGSRPFGVADVSIERAGVAPSTGSFIHAGGDHGDANILSSCPRFATRACASRIIGIIPASTSCFTESSKWASASSPVTLSKLYDAGEKSHELIGTRPSVYPRLSFDGSSKYRLITFCWSCFESALKLTADASVNAPPKPTISWYVFVQSTTSDFSAGFEGIGANVMGFWSSRSLSAPPLSRWVAVHAMSTVAEVDASMEAAAMM